MYAVREAPSSASRKRVGRLWPTTLLAFALASCTYNPRFGDCLVTSCDGPSDCPSGYSCDSDHFCRAPTASLSTSCADVLEDSGISLVDSSSSGDGNGTPSCSGTAMACETLGTLNNCNAQSGCSWNGSTGCKLILDCTQISAADCNSYAECQLQSGSCVENPFQCSIVPDEPRCEERTPCDWITSGCKGTPTACSEITSSAPCMVHRGCTWN
jgi:hypothetical protein